MWSEENHPVDNIPEGEWWSSSNRDVFIDVYERLSVGIEEGELLDMLASLYYAVAAEYGD